MVCIASSMRALRFVLDPSLTELGYRCYPDGCPRGRTCCVGLVVEVSRREVRAIDTLMDELARLAPGLRDGQGFENVFVDDPPDVLIESRADGSCPFLFRTRRHALCAIHSVALRTGRRGAALKPPASPPRPAGPAPARGAARAPVGRAPIRSG